MPNMGRGMERVCFYFLSFIHDRSKKSSIYCDQQPDGVMIAYKVSGNNVKHRFSFMDNRIRKLNIHVQQQNDHLYRKTAPILHQFDRSRDIGKKGIAHMYSRRQWCTFFKLAYFLGQRPRKFKVNSDFVKQHLCNFVSNLCTC